jgi:hypothetical protein
MRRLCLMIRPAPRPIRLAPAAFPAKSAAPYRQSPVIQQLNPVGGVMRARIPALTAWLAPFAIIPARLLRFGIRIDY